MLNRILSTVLKKNNKKLFLSLLSLVIVMGGLSFYAWITPRTPTQKSDGSLPGIDTTYAYQAVVTPNVLHPDGGTVKVGDTLYKNITTALPIDLTSIIRAEEEVLAKGSYDVQLLIKAGGNWERSFTLQNKESFDNKGTDIIVIDSSYQIDLAKVEAFILQVEKETGVRQTQYELEVVPTIQGELKYADKVMEFNTQDKLVFNYLPEELKLASEKFFSTTIQPNESQSATPLLNIFGMTISLTIARIGSTSLFLLLLLSILFSLIYLDEGPVHDGKSEAERLSKKYGRRVISISKQIDFADKTIVYFTTFRAMLKIANDIEQPIFFYESVIDHSQMYLIVDIICVYAYAPNTDVPPPARPAKATRNRKEFVIS